MFLYTFCKLVTKSFGSSFIPSLPSSPGGGLEEAATLTPLTRLSMATFSLCSMSRTRLRRGCKCSFAYLGGRGTRRGRRMRGGWRKNKKERGEMKGEGGEKRDRREET